MYDDPIVKEVHQTRERLLKKHGGLRGLLNYIQEHPEPGEKTVSFAASPTALRPVKPASRTPAVRVRKGKVAG